MEAYFTEKSKKGEIKKILKAKIEKKRHQGSFVLEAKHGEQF